MFINPRSAVDQGWLHYVPEKNIQPNAVDVSLDEIYAIDCTTPFHLTHNSKIHRKRERVVPFTIEPKELPEFFGWFLPSGIYDFVSNVYVEMPKNTTGWFVLRSTLNRNGLIVLSGLYDSGYKGPLAGTLHVPGDSYIQVGTPITQFAMAQSASEGLYAGGYNVEKGEKADYLK